MINQSNKLLVCLDLSNMDTILIRYSAFIADLLDMDDVHFLHVIKEFDVPQELVDEFPELDQPLDEILRDELTETITQELSQLESTIKPTIHVVYGHALETILETSVTLNADITLVGKKTTYKGTGLILSSIASFMENSVMFVPEQTRTSIDHIMVPIDFTEASLTALKAAAQFAAKSSAQITTQHVFELPAQFFPLTTPTEDLADKARSVLRAKAEKFIAQSELKDQTIDYVFTLSEGRKLSEVVRHEALQQMADMIVLGSKGKNPTSALFRGTVVEKLVQSDFSVPLFIIKDKKRMKGLLNFFQKAES